MKYISCMYCNNGHYILKDYMYRYYAECSNPYCRAYLTIDNWVLAYIHRHGIEIYQWERECWRCKKKTPVYSYYLDYELSELDGCFITEFSRVGLGDIPYLDKLLEKRYSTVKTIYSKSAKECYIANTCKYCGFTQGKYYVVEDPHEILDSLLWVHDMYKYYLETVWFRKIEPLRADIKQIYGN